ncbi:hypothetical protein [Paenibacillus popilliae]|uniref:Uncharacterized protein n=1 Tax=Paenibacillus popilliae TaxID=78057 RepID=A0ABY3ALC8_PAEPP|nr:hypothetical protein [Paenibacillus sp. SDF0028]TQR43381.1 hypothetical protein C7Y44_19685 [Paenibacillus sp. SDF0028]
MYVLYDNFKKVTTIYQNPVPDQMSGTGLLVDGDIPQPKYIHGMNPVLKIDTEKMQLYYDYEKPDTIESRVADLQKENTELKLALAELAELVAGGVK